MSIYNKRPANETEDATKVVLKDHGYISPAVKHMVPSSVCEQDMACEGRVALSVRLMEIQNASNSKIAASELRLLCAQCAVNDVCLLGRARKK